MSTSHSSSDRPAYAMHLRGKYFLVVESANSEVGVHVLQVALNVDYWEAL